MDFISSLTLFLQISILICVSLTTISEFFISVLELFITIFKGFIIIFKELAMQSSSYGMISLISLLDTTKFQSLLIYYCNAICCYLMLLSFSCRILATIRSRL
jgi:hypothetical protein